MPENGKRSSLPVIAIGASAGGLEACRTLMKDLGSEHPAAFVLVLHLDPSHDSMMVDLLANGTTLNIVQATDGMMLKAGHLHVIPPGLFLSVAQNKLHLTVPDNGRAVRLPFDVLLRTLAKDAGPLSGCIVLSGTGTDGSKGIADIHAARGLIIAQDPDEAAYPGMPQSAIETGLVARTLKICQMAKAIDKFLHDGSYQTLSYPTSHQPSRLPDKIPDHSQLEELLTFLGGYASQDISLYKHGTLQRRIARRMGLIGLGPNEIARYFEVLQSDAEECAQLSADLLIHVTCFFRDSYVFDQLSIKVLPSLIADLPAGSPLRIWVAGCSTGEEAFSFAMLCIEALEVAGSRAQLQILASDIDPESIESARRGFFPKEIEADVSKERLKRFFTPESGGWRVTSAIRDVIVFTVADLLSDPPFSKIDFVSCRNVMIYLTPEAQKRVIARCCFALRSGGLLLLGTAEMPGECEGRFVIEDKKSRLWRRVGQGHLAGLHYDAPKRDGTSDRAAFVPPARSAVADLCRQAVLEHHAPAAALLNSRMEVLYLLGPTEKYLTITEGHANLGIIGMLPKALRTRMTIAVASCTETNPLVTVPGEYTNGINSFFVILHAVPSGSEPMLLACFIDVMPRLVPASYSPALESQIGDVAILRADLAATRHDLSEALLDLDQEVEAHAADAAEALSINEEFQSTNEELLASKEELQSLNEELTALNSQLQETLEQQRTTANDLQNVLYSTDVATLFLDLNLNIRFFTPAARIIFRVIPSDVGRPLADLASVSNDNDLTEDAKTVLVSLEPKERETAGANGTWFLRRIQPYRAEGDKVEGVVITYIDITERKRTNVALVATMREANRATKAKSRFLAAASHDLRQPLQSMALLNKLQARHKPSTEGARLALLLDQTLSSMTNMLDSMLEVNRIQTGTVQPKIQPVALTPLMSQLAEEFRPQCDLKRLKMRWVPCSLWADTDPQLLEQILRNLLSNALKYTPSGGILMGCRRQKDTVSIVVCDSGIGIAAADTKTIFDSYHQVETTATLAGRGLGLGLSIVQSLAHLMDHPIAVRSTLGKGSAFMVTLPRAKLVSEAAPKLAASPIQKRPQKKAGTILVVDDAAPLRKLLSELLSKEGHRVIEKATPKDALAWANQNRVLPDILLTDFDFRKSTTGLKLAQNLMRIWGIEVPTIVLTGDITLATAKRIEIEGHHHLVKPVMPETLTTLISDILSKITTAKTSDGHWPQARCTTIHVVDDDPMIRDTMRRLFEVEGWKVVTHASAEEFLEIPTPEQAACLLVDNRLPGMNGVALIALLRSQNSNLPAVMITGHGDASMAVAAMKAGASDLIEKPASAADLLESVRQAIITAKGGQALAGARALAQKRFAKLSERERDVLKRVLDGSPNKIIAADLNINQRTVENHRASVMRKTGATSLPDLVRLALAADTQSA